MAAGTLLSSSAATPDHIFMSTCECWTDSFEEPAQAGYRRHGDMVWRASHGSSHLDSL